MTKVWPRIKPKLMIPYRKDRLSMNRGLYCIEVLAGIYKVQRLEGKPPRYVWQSTIHISVGPGDQGGE